VKTRIIQTKFWDDSVVIEMNANEKLLFMFLLSNPKTNKCGIYEISDYEIIFLTGIKKADLMKAKSSLTEKGKVLFFESWVAIVNSDKYNGYKNSESHKADYDREISLVPEELKTSLEKMKTSPRLVIKHKTKNINKKKSFGESENLLEKAEPEQQPSAVGGTGTYRSLESLGEFEFRKLAEDFSVPIAFVLSKYDDLETYCGQHGKSYKNYYLALRSWVKTDAMKIKEDGKSKSKIAVIS